MISDFESTGGAAIAASRLAVGLNSLGHEVVRIVSRAEAKRKAWRTLELFEGRKSLILRHLLPNAMFLPLVRRVAEHDYVRRLREILDNEKADIVNVHNIHGSPWHPNVLEVCRERFPVVWTLHDMWSFAATFYDFRGVEALAGPERTHLPDARTRRRIEDFWQGSTNGSWSQPLCAVTPSSWLAEEARRSHWKSFEVRIIANPLPLEVFRPLDRMVARRALEIPTDRVVALVCGANLEEPRMGSGLLKEALNRLNQNLHIVTVGNGGCSLESGTHEWQHFGFVDHDHLMVLLYSAADFLVHPHPVDNLPNTIAESLACGTPVAAFPVGGVSEMVIPGETGWLASEVTSAALRASVGNALADIRGEISMRSSCRAFAERHYDMKTQSKVYLEFFSSMLSGNKAGKRH